MKYALQSTLSYSPTLHELFGIICSLLMYFKSGVFTIVAHRVAFCDDQVVCVHLNCRLP